LFGLNRYTERVHEALDAAGFEKVAEQKGKTAAVWAKKGAAVMHEEGL
jgi:hypothetical protein